MKILLTGFEAFGTVEKNPSQVIVEHLTQSNNLSDRIDLVTQVLPVEYGTTGDIIRQLIAHHDPDAVVMLGVASSRNAIHLEYHAANCDTATTGDTAGKIHTNRIIDSRFDYYFKRSSTLPIDYLFCELQAHDIPVARSYDAGGYVCNHLFFHALSFTSEECNKPIKTGFVHVPTFESIDMDKQVQAVELILEAVADPEIDKKQYQHPLIQNRLSRFFEKMPNEPDWCSLTTIDGIHVAHVGESATVDRISAISVATEGLGDRALAELVGDDFGFGIWGNKSGLILVANLQVIPYLLTMKWSKNVSLASVYQASKALSQAIKPLVELLS